MKRQLILTASVAIMLLLSGCFSLLHPEYNTTVFTDEKIAILEDLLHFKLPEDIQLTKINYLTGQGSDGDSFSLYVKYNHERFDDYLNALAHPISVVKTPIDGYENRGFKFVYSINCALRTEDWYVSSVYYSNKDDGIIISLATSKVRGQKEALLQE
ncbi:hypothetical protein FACS1894217_10710 [Clostridia bacterium]|nr:hypothetical protein FACS1894217_10710 [Clostridia bacterium]